MPDAAGRKRNLRPATLLLAQLRLHPLTPAFLLGLLWLLTMFEMSSLLVAVLRVG